MIWPAASVSTRACQRLQAADLTAGKDVLFSDRGEHDLKGIAEPQRLFAVREE